MTTATAMAAEKSSTHVLKHYAMEAVPGFQTVRIPKGAKIHGIEHKDGQPQLITSHPPDPIDWEHRLLNLVMHNGEVPEVSNYLGRTSADPSNPVLPLLHVFDCGAAEKPATH